VPAEAIVKAGIFPLAVGVMPIHPLAFLTFMGRQIIYNVIGHTGCELHPRWLMDSWPGKVLKTPTNHAMHHESMRGNSGLYFKCFSNRTFSAGSEGRGASMVTMLPRISNTRKRGMEVIL